jgi:transposase-like protein
MGRPSKLTEERQETICEALRKGVSIEGACQLAGVSDRAYYKWRERGEEELRRVEEGHHNCRVRKDEEPYVQFFQETTRAIGESEEYLVEKIYEAAPETPNAALRLLERRFPDRWSKKQKVEHSGDGFTVRINPPESDD